MDQAPGPSLGFAQKPEGVAGIASPTGRGRRAMRVRVEVMGNVARAFRPSPTLSQWERDFLVWELL